MMWRNPDRSIDLLWHSWSMRMSHLIGSCFLLFSKFAVTLCANHYITTATKQPITCFSLQIAAAVVLQTSGNCWIELCQRTKQKLLLTSLLSSFSVHYLLLLSIGGTSLCGAHGLSVCLVWCLLSAQDKKFVYNNNLRNGIVVFVEKISSRERRSFLKAPEPSHLLDTADSSYQGIKLFLYFIWQLSWHAVYQ